MKMMQDATQNKFDMIITKSISRFGRNTVDTLKYVRLLKEKGIAIYFEEERINTLEISGEIMLTVMSAMVGAHTRIKENLWDVFFHTKAYKKAGKQAEERAQKALELTGLSDNPYYYGTDLPYGKQRRLEIARAIASDPEVLMFDEPAAGMNEGETADLTGFIREIREAG